MRSNDIKIAFFPKITENRHAGGGFAPRPPSVIRLRYTSLITHVSQYRHFHRLAFGLSPLPLAKPWLGAQPGHCF